VFEKICECFRTKWGIEVSTEGTLAFLKTENPGLNNIVAMTPWPYGILWGIYVVVLTHYSEFLEPVRDYDNRPVKHVLLVENTPMGANGEYMGGTGTVFIAYCFKFKAIAWMWSDYYRVKLCLHEMGHGIFGTITHENRWLTLGCWTSKMEGEKQVWDYDSDKENPPSKYCRGSLPGCSHGKQPTEDIAESARLYYNSPDKMRNIAPRRLALFADMIQITKDRITRLKSHPNEGWYFK